MLRVLATASLLCASMIGAGIATGKEVAIYFERYSALTATLGGVFSGALCYLFLRSDYHYHRIHNYLHFAEDICAVFVLMAMLTALASMYSDSSLPVVELSLLISIFLSLFPLKVLQYSNIPIVITIIVCIALLYFNSAELSIRQPTNPIVSLSYASMNILLTSSLCEKSGKGKSRSFCFAVSLICGLIMGAVIYAVYRIAINYNSDNMPLLSAAKALNLHRAYSVSLYLSIFSTLTSAVCILVTDGRTYFSRFFDFIKESGTRLSSLVPLLPDPTLCIVLLIFLLYCLSTRLQFASVVAGLYPIIGWVGYVKIGYAILTFVSNR